MMEVKSHILFSSLYNLHNDSIPIPSVNSIIELPIICHNPPSLRKCGSTATSKPKLKSNLRPFPDRKIPISGDLSPDPSSSST